MLSSHHPNLHLNLQANDFRPQLKNVITYRLRTPNEGINQRNLKIWANAMWQTKYASGVPTNLEVGVDFRPCSEAFVNTSAFGKNYKYFFFD